MTRRVWGIGVAIALMACVALAIAIYEKGPTARVAVQEVAIDAHGIAIGLVAEHEAEMGTGNGLARDGSIAPGKRVRLPRLAGAGHPDGSQDEIEVVGLGAFWIDVALTNRMVGKPPGGGDYAPDPTRIEHFVLERGGIASKPMEVGGLRMRVTVLVRRPANGNRG